MEISVFDDAVRAYAKYCVKNGLILDQPDESMSVIDREYVHLENKNGPLGKYEIATGKILA